MRALVVANGEPCSQVLAAELRAGAAIVVAADGGADRALALGIEPDAVVGDLDSASDEARATLPADRFHHVGRLDMTDLQKAIGFALERGAQEVDVICAGGGRADHALANLSVLATFRGRAHVVIHDDLFAICLVDGSEEFTAEPGTVVSLVAIGDCHGVSTSGLRWDLFESTLGFSPLGVHNEVVRSPARVSVATGDLLLFRGRWVEHHT